MSPEPYYSDSMVQLYLGDCREITEWLAADVLVMDPPYGIGYRSHRSTDMGSIAGDNDVTTRDHILAMWGTARPALVFGRWDIPRPVGIRSRLVWDKMLLGRGDYTWPWAPSDEEIHVLGDWPAVVPGGRIREGGRPARHPSVLRFQAYAPGALTRPDHPTPKPLPLMAWLIERCPDGVIADPCTGSGSTLLAARLLGRRAIGVELDEEYCERAALRLAEPDLFGGAA